MPSQKSIFFKEKHSFRILIASYRFWPEIGGLEAVAKLLAERLLESGYAVSVVTDSKASDLGEEISGYPVLRKPSPRELWSAVKEADLIVVNHPSLRVCWPLIVQQRPFVVIAQTWVSFSGLSGALRRLLFQRAAARIAISKAIERHFPVKGMVIPNPYDEKIFFLDERIPRTRDLLFVGRMVSGKGALNFVTALSLLRDKGMTPSASLVGDGPDLLLVQARIRDLHLDSQVRVYGCCNPEKVATLMREHRILVVPSVWEEPFGIVALEGIACGCAVIGSSGGGLPEAIGPCGLTYPNGNVPELARRIEEVLDNPDLIQRLRAQAKEHLLQYTGSAIANRYIELFQNILDKP